VHLAAARLVGRELDVVAQPFENADDGPARLREKRVAKAGDEERDAQSAESNPAVDSNPMRPDVLARFAAATEAERVRESMCNLS
jgi:hypothetical protein